MIDTSNSKQIVIFNRKRNDDDKILDSVEVNFGGD